MNREQFEAELARIDRERKRTSQVADMMHERTMACLLESDALRAKWAKYEWIYEPPWCFVWLGLFIILGAALGTVISFAGSVCHVH